MRGWLEDQLHDLNVAVKQFGLVRQRNRSRSASPGAAATRGVTDRGVTDPGKNAHDGGDSGGKGPAHSITMHGYSSVAVEEGPASPQLLDSIADAIVIVRDDAGFLETTVLSHQEELLTQAQEELCVQVGEDVVYAPLFLIVRDRHSFVSTVKVASSCLERGHTMSQLWAALR